ncbi:zinc transporter ZIP13-like isoform X2 [Lineus longissimus]
MHVKKGQEHQHGTSIGLWVMCGILTFLIIEKIFPANSEEFEDNIEEEIPRLSDMKQVEDISAEVNHNQNIIQSKTSTISNKLPGNKQTVTKEDYLKHRYLKSNSMKSKSKEVLNGEGGNDEVMEYDTGGKKKNMEGTIHVRGYLNLMANVIDNFTHGLAVGGSYIVSTKVGLLTTFAIMVHEIPHEVGDFAILLRSGFDRWQAAKAQLFTASGSLLGAIVALTADSVEAAGDSTAWILPFTSGGFIYIALVTVAPDLLKEKDTWESFKQVMGVCLGVCTMAFVTILCG